MSVFEHVELAPADPILGLTEAFKADERTSKVNLGIGVYLDDQGRIPLMECVRAEEDRLAAAAKPHVYLGIDGDPARPLSRRSASPRCRASAAPAR